ncbi:hypothetical protein N692_11325 [Lactiplantibacillus plantarum EGD-AQ4]|nr:hypothetical protein N692_11325 [Lactiplantibacillus plantarum EGD-AQ4]
MILNIEWYALAQITQSRAEIQLSLPSEPELTNDVLMTQFIKY